MSEARVLHFFGGKGGAGKTTLSTAFALNLSDDQPKDKVLLVSLDPVESLTDLSKKKLSAKQTKLAAGKGNGGLFGAELDPKAALEAFLKEYRPALVAAAQKGALLGADEVAKILEQSIPGLEELCALLQISGWLEDKSY